MAPLTEEDKIKRVFWCILMEYEAEDNYITTLYERINKYETLPAWAQSAKLKISLSKQRSSLLVELTIWSPNIGGISISQ